ncbi:hypothetical protein LTR64_000314 [Lithohypha guttulata]|uniref:uncharacterized protein n=1 Tax=Lithohypha guttulata TaxID=1690604 RepID=UPI002DE152E1|nr:hypothetical protein LTR51_007673 [Lithohypha guttulata]
MSALRKIAFLSVLAAPAAAFWRLPCKSTIVVERVDPIVAPGNISGHVHQIMGGNGFDFEMDFADTQASTCTSCTVHGDFSNYWTPVLYYQHQDGTFEKVNQLGGGLVYYLQRSGPNKDKLQAFPEGFRMISGDPFKRSSGNDFASQAISYACLDYSGPAKPETPGFPTYNCPSGLRSQVFFPSCWDGKNLDSADHKSHMSFPIGAYNDGKCPDTHPVHLVSIFYEIIWDTNKFKDMWYGNKQPFVWAQGDPTGYGFHGDFLMGWNRDLLQRAVDQCTSDSGRVEDCPVFNLYPDSTAEGCKIASKIDEDIQGPFSKLPGCNPVQPGPDRAQIIATCEGNTATIGQGKPFFKDLTSQGWGYQGCGTDNYYARALTGASTSQAGMTNEQCIAFCGGKGFSTAGTQYSKECYCGNSIPASAQPVAGVVGNCNMPCDGDATQNCGGSSLLSLYQKCTGSTCSNAAGVGGGSSASASSSVSSAKSSSISQQIKVQSTTTTTRLLARGTSSSSSSSSSSTSSSASKITPSPSSSKTSTSSTSSSTTQSLSSSTSKPSSPTSSSSSSSASPIATSTSTLPPNWTYRGCITDAINPRTLPKLAPYTLDNKQVTSTSCVSYCSKAGYVYAGTEYGGECWCGNDAPITAKLDESKCGTPCKGDLTQKCGGPSALSLYAAGGKTKRDGEEQQQLEVVKEHMKRHGRGRFGRGAFL